MDAAYSSLPELLAVTVIVAGLSLAAWLAAFAVVIWCLRRRNRVAPDVRTPAPLGWLASPSWAARLHRRLRRSAEVARASAARSGSPMVADLAAELVEQAVLVDADLVAAAQLPVAARWAALSPLAERTATISRSALRLAGLAARAAGPAPASRSLDRVSERIELLVEAHADLERLERTPGLARH